MSVDVDYLLGDVRDLLNDPNDTQIDIDTKICYLNRGQAAMFPKIYRITVAEQELVDDVFTYEDENLLGTLGRLLTVGVEYRAGTGRYTPFVDYISPYNGLIEIQSYDLPAPAGNKIRSIAMVPLRPLVATVGEGDGDPASQYSGPAGTEELPVLYAVALSASKQLDDRLSYRRMNVMNVNNPIQPGDISGASSFWFNQFYMLLDSLEMPPPSARY